MGQGSDATDPPSSPNEQNPDASQTLAKVPGPNLHLSLYAPSLDDRKRKCWGIFGWCKSQEGQVSFPNWSVLCLGGMCCGALTKSLNLCEPYLPHLGNGIILASQG